MTTTAMPAFKDGRTAATVDTARRAAEHGAYERCVTLLAEADGYEAWSGAGSSAPSRVAIAATIGHVRARQRAIADRERAAESLAADFDSDVMEWTV